jgi:hypothetical protein
MGASSARRPWQAATRDPRNRARGLVLNGSTNADLIRGQLDAIAKILQAGLSLNIGLPGRKGRKMFRPSMIERPGAGREEF